MKRFAVLVLMMVSAVALFANGNAEARAAEAPGLGRAAEAAVDGEPVNLTGTLVIVDDHIVLDADGTTYLLGIPRAGWYIDQVEEGMEVTVEGVIPTDPLSEPHDDVVADAHVSVSRILIDGEELDLDIAPAGRGRSATDFERGAGRLSADDETLERGRGAGRRGRI